MHIKMKWTTKRKERTKKENQGKEEEKNDQGVTDTRIKPVSQVERSICSGRPAD